MNEHTPPSLLDSAAASHENSAWVSIEIPIARSALFDFLQNIERLFRLNPYLDIQIWEAESAQRFHLVALNEMNGVGYDFYITRESVQPGSEFRLRYSQGLKHTLDITLQPAPNPSATILTLREHYHETTPEKREQQLKEVDHSLIPWGAAIRRYVLGMKRWAWFRPYRWYHEKTWLKMRPTHRRIARMILWVTALEFVVFLFVFIIYWLELARR